MISLSTSLEKVQEAQFLGMYIFPQFKFNPSSETNYDGLIGPHPAARFQRALVLGMERSMSNCQRSAHPLALPYKALNAAERIRSAVARRNVNPFVRYEKTLLGLHR